jgi:hypothetical protein
MKKYLLLIFLSRREAQNMIVSLVPDIEAFLRETNSKSFQQFLFMLVQLGKLSPTN